MTAERPTTRRARLRALLHPGEDCPHCFGDGIAIYGRLDYDEVVPVERDCRDCEGTGVRQWRRLPALALGSALQAWDVAHGDYLAAAVLCAVAGKEVRVQR